MIPSNWPKLKITAQHVGLSSIEAFGKKWETAALGGITDGDINRYLMLYSDVDELSIISDCVDCERYSALHVLLDLQHVFLEHDKDGNVDLRWPGEAVSSGPFDDLYALEQHCSTHWGDILKSIRDSAYADRKKLFKEHLEWAEARKDEILDEQRKRRDRERLREERLQETADAGLSPAWSAQKKTSPKTPTENDLTTARKKLERNEPLTVRETAAVTSLSDSAVRDHAELKIIPTGTRKVLIEAASVKALLSKRNI